MLGYLLLPSSCYLDKQYSIQFNLQASVQCALGFLFVQYGAAGR